MKSYDVIGYVVDCEIYCPECAPVASRDGDIPDPIFAESETDCPNHCAECEELIPQNLTDHGVEYVQAAVLKYLTTNGKRGRGEILLRWLSEWDWAAPDASELVGKIMERKD